MYMYVCIHREKERIKLMSKHINKQTLKLNNPKGRIIYNQNKKTIPNLGFQREDKTGNLIIMFQVKEQQLNETQLEELEKWFESF